MDQVPQVQQQRIGSGQVQIQLQGNQGDILPSSQIRSGVPQPSGDDTPSTGPKTYTSQPASQIRSGGVPQPSGDDSPSMGPKTCTSLMKGLGAQRHMEPDGLPRGKNGGDSGAFGHFLPLPSIILGLQKVNFLPESLEERMVRVKAYSGRSLRR